MGKFTSGIDINVFDFVGHRLKKEELRLRKQALKAKELQAWPEQNHSAHIKAHRAFMSSSLVWSILFFSKSKRRRNRRVYL